MRLKLVLLAMIMLAFFCLTVGLVFAFFTTPYHWVEVAVPARMEWKNLNEANGLGVLATLSGIATIICAAFLYDAKR